MGLAAPWAQTFLECILTPPKPPPRSGLAELPRFGGPVDHFDVLPGPVSEGPSKPQRAINLGLLNIPGRQALLSHSGQILRLLDAFLL